MKSKVLLGIMVWSLVAVASAQDDPGARPSTPDVVGGLPFVGEVEVTVVNVNVYVTDKDGNAVTDLTADDFTLIHNGVPKPISNFDLYTDKLYRTYFSDTAAPAGLPTSTPIPGTEGLSRDSFRPVYLVLYFDNENSRALDRNRLITQMRSFIRENLNPPVQMMVISYSKTSEVLVPFTTDDREVYDALREIKTMVGGRTEIDNTRKDILRDIAESQRSSSGRRDPQAMSRAHGQLIGFAEEEANSLQFTLGALRDTLTMLSGLPGKKMIIYISNGLPMIPGLDLFYAFANSFQESSVVTESSRFNMSRYFDTLVSNANAQDVSLYTFGVGGLENPTLSSAELGSRQDVLSASMGMQNYLDPLRYMADGTGGTATLNTNDFTKGLDRVAQDLFTYYSLGFPLQQSGLDKIHKIKVEIPGHPEYRVRYRQRFVEKSLESRVQDKVVTGLMFPLEDNPMELMIEVGDQAPATETRWMVPFKISFPLRKIALVPTGDEYVANVSLFVAARNDRGDRSDVVRQSHEIRVDAADYDSAQLERYTISTNLLMDAGNHSIAVGLLDPVTRQSSYTATKVTVRE